jgi:hypothetical protein
MRGWGIGLACLLLLGCGWGGSPRKPLHGQITLQGKPVGNGAINLFPVGSNGGPVAYAPIQNGAYQFSAETGPHAGAHRVVIDLNHLTPAEALGAGGKKESKQLPAPVAVNPVKTQWELEFSVPPEGNFHKQFDLQP